MKNISRRIQGALVFLRLLIELTMYLLLVLTYIGWNKVRHGLSYRAVWK